MLYASQRAEKRSTSRGTSGLKMGQMFEGAYSDSFIGLGARCLRRSPGRSGSRETCQNDRLETIIPHARVQATIFLLCSLQLEADGRTRGGRTRID